MALELVTCPEIFYMKVPFQVAEIDRSNNCPNNQDIKCSENAKGDHLEIPNILWRYYILVVPANFYFVYFIVTQPQALTIRMNRNLKLFKNGISAIHITHKCMF